MPIWLFEYLEFESIITHLCSADLDYNYDSDCFVHTFLDVAYHHFGFWMLFLTKAQWGLDIVCYLIHLWCGGFYTGSFIWWEVGQCWNPNVYGL